MAGVEDTCGNIWAMPEEKPDYRVYRARPGFLSRLFGRDDPASRLERQREHDLDSVRQLSGRRPAAGTAAPEAPPRVPGAPTYPPPREPREPWWRRITWKRAILGVLGFIVFWLALSLVLFMISAGQQAGKVSDGTKAALDDSGNMLTSPNNVLVLGSDRRPGEERGRADTIMLMRYGGGKAARLSIPRDTLVDIPGTGPSKINAAYAIGGPALMIETIKQYLGIEVNHLVEIDFKGFVKFVDALGGVNMTFDTCIRSRFEGRTHRFAKGENHLDGEEALDIVRIRKNECAPEESDLTRARRQQQFLEAVKGKLFSPLTFPRYPWVAWRAPKAIRSDMGGTQLLTLYWNMETSGELKPRILRPINPGANPLQVSEAEKQAEVQRFLDG
jgi:LCP family protein required for cell wall assembly